jgi:hypothetical protein
MASTDFENTAVEKDPQIEEEANASDGAVPLEKSSVDLYPDPLNVPPKFEKGDSIHMTIKENGAARRAVLAVRRARFSQSGGYWEYQLGVGKELYGKGVWVRERDLKLERKGGY